MFERHRDRNGKKFYSPMRGGVAYELIGGEYVKTSEVVFPVLCKCANKEFPLSICQKCTDNAKMLNDAMPDRICL